MWLLFSLLALLCGAFIAVQASTNTVLLQHFLDPWWVALSLFTAGWLVLFVCTVSIGGPAPGIEAISNAPLWSYFGGVIVALYVVLITCLVTKIGLANAIFLVVCGQVVASVVIDHFGAFGVAAHTITWPRVIGVLCLALGVWLARN